MKLLSVGWKPSLGHYVVFIDKHDNRKRKKVSRQKFLELFNKLFKES